MTKEEKNRMIDAQLKQYEIKLYQHEINRTALSAIGDDQGCKDMDERIESLRKAYKAVEAMKEV